MRDPSLLTIERAGRMLRTGETTARELTERCLEQIDRHAGLNAFILVLVDDARGQAVRADAELAAGHDRGPLHGIPISIKDLIDIERTTTTAASRVREHHRAIRDAALIARLRQAGATLIGKTNLHEFALGTTNEDSAYGPARNPHDPARSPGGSSGGSAVSVATGMALGTIGTDTGGSIRIPAAACGIVGLKPTIGEVPTDGVVPLSQTLDHAGPLALTVGDAALLYHALIGETPRPVRDPDPAGGLELAIPRGYLTELLDDEVRARFDGAIDELRRTGATIVEAELPHSSLTPAVYLHIQGPEAAAYHAATLERVPDLYTLPVRLRLEMSRYVLGEDYIRALAGREALRREVDLALGAHDALALPTLPIPAPRLGAETTSIAGATHPVRPLTLRLTQLFNVTGHPAISIPCGETADGLPVGLQLVGRHGQTAALLRVALACEAVIGKVPGG